MSERNIDSATLDRWLRGPGELAVLDVRSEAEFVQHGAPLFASNLPAEQLQVKIASRVPRRSVRLVLVDGGDGSAAHLATDLKHQGYTDVHALEDGLPGWVRSGRLHRARRCRERSLWSDG